MLRQLFRRLDPALHADFGAADLSDAFQTLSRRIEAMQHFMEHARRQSFFLTCAIALPAATAVVPWRVVAQEGKGIEVATGKVESVPAETEAVVQEWGTLRGRFIYDGVPPEVAKFNAIN